MSLIVAWQLAAVDHKYVWIYNVAGDASCCLRLGTQQQQPICGDTHDCVIAMQLLVQHCFHARPGTSMHLFEIDQ